MKPGAQRVLVTGAGRGLGLALLKKLVESGRYVFAGARNIGAQRRAAPGLDEGCSWLTLDVTSEDSVRRAFESLAGTTDRLDVVINNAGVHLGETVDRKIGDIDVDNFRATFEVNTVGPLLVLKYAARFLTGAGIVINISSDSGSIADCGQSSWYDYNMSKAALNMASKILHNDFAPRGVKVLAVHPGWVQTDMGGPDAQVPVAEAAADITALLDRRWTSDDPIFIDRHGHRMNW